MMGCSEKIHSGPNAFPRLPILVDSAMIAMVQYQGKRLTRLFLALLIFVQYVLGVLRREFFRDWYEMEASIEDYNATLSRSCRSSYRMLRN